MALPRPRLLVRWANSMASRMASTRISLLGLRFLSSMSFCAFSLKDQPCASRSVSGISTHRSAWVCTLMAWQLVQWPQPKPSGCGCSHNQARASAMPSACCPSPDGPCSSQAWPRCCNKCTACCSIQGDSAAPVWSGCCAVSVALLLLAVGLEDAVLVTASLAVAGWFGFVATRFRAIGLHQCAQCAAVLRRHGGRRRRLRG